MTEGTRATMIAIDRYLLVVERCVVAHRGGVVVRHAHEAAGHVHHVALVAAVFLNLLLQKLPQVLGRHDALVRLGQAGQQRDIESEVSKERETSAKFIAHASGI